MIDFNKKLNKEQNDAVNYVRGPLAVVAGAGSGKTKMIIHKIAYLIEVRRINPERILAVAFTNKAANEMKERLIKLIGEKAFNMQISTYHSFCSKILRKEISQIGYANSFNIVDKQDQKHILSPIYKKYDISPKTLSYSSSISYISKNKILFNSPEELIKKSKNDNEKILANIYKDYSESIKKVNSLDFDDLLIKTKELFDKFPKIAKNWSNKYDYVLVDEFQDTSLLQYNIIKKVSQHNKITIVGDPDQTIYTWRQADVDLINNFQDYFRKPKIIKLIQNYRSAKTILEKANRLIVHNQNRIHKTLIPNNKKKGNVDFHHASSDDSEARWIVQQIIRLRKKRYQLKDIAILYRANYLSATIEKALINSGINYVVFGGIKFFQRKEIKDIVSFIKILNNYDEFGFKRMINVPSRKIGEVTLQKIENFVNSKNKTLYQGIISHWKELPINNQTRKELLKFVNLINKYKKALETNPIHLVLKHFLKEINYLSIWNLATDQSRVENVQEFIKEIKSWEKKNKSKNINDYVNEISLYTDKSEYSFASDYVSLMTVHAAKGLEFQNIFICGFSDGIFPSKRAMSEGGDLALEEERRLAYVAVTRTKTNLFISDSIGFSIDNKFPKKPSRFLKEMDIDVKKFTKKYISVDDFKENYLKNRDFVIGDNISHTSFGNGVIVNIRNDVVDVVFQEPYGTKTLLKNHKSIERLK